MAPFRSSPIPATSADPKPRLSPVQEPRARACGFARVRLCLPCAAPTRWNGGLDRPTCARICFRSCRRCGVTCAHWPRGSLESRSYAANAPLWSPPSARNPGRPLDRDETVSPIPPFRPCPRWSKPVPIFPHPPVSSSGSEIRGRTVFFLSFPPPPRPFRTFVIRISEGPVLVFSLPPPPDRIEILPKIPIDSPRSSAKERRRDPERWRERRRSVCSCRLAFDDHVRRASDELRKRGRAARTREARRCSKRERGGAGGVEERTGWDAARGSGSWCT